MLISIIMPTYNSEHTLHEVLESLNKQSIDKSQMEVLIIDGGSQDRTLEIATTYKFVKVHNNEKRLPEIAKHIGFINAQGEYGMYLDSDEILQNKDSIINRIEILQDNVNVKNIVSTGMISREGERGIVCYANFIADPFSKFVYRFNGCNRMDDITKQYPTKEIINGKLIDFRNVFNLPLFDAAGNMFEMKCARKIYEKEKNKDEFIANIFDKMVSETKCAVIMMNDFIIHIPQLTVKKYFRKLRWRVKNNIFADKNEGVGFANRQKINPYLKMRKYLYIPYCLLIFPALSDAIRFSIMNKKKYFLIHIIFSWYVFLCILFYETAKILHLKYRSIEIYG